jgi:hypothetical protein
MHIALPGAVHAGKWARELAALLAVGAILGWLGPYGTYFCFDTPDRFGYWMLRSLLVGLTCLAAFQVLAAGEPVTSWPATKRALVALFIASLPCALIGLALATLFHHAPTSPLQFAALYGRVAIVTVIVGFPLHLIRATAARERAIQPARQASAAPAAVVPNGAAFLRRIPAKLGSELLYIAMEDHYLRVHTRRGSDPLLLRLSDAVAELGPVIGRQVHRSHWVARQAVSSVERDGYRTWLVLTTGMKIPVSRTYLPALREAGWL